MTRRSFLHLTAACLASLALPAMAAPNARNYRIGILALGSAAQSASRIDSFRQGLNELGWANALVIEEKYADGDRAQLSRLASELVTTKVDVIVTVGGADVVRAAMAATKTIPIVFPTADDPVQQKLVTSLARPGGNVTGLSNMSAELYGKRVALLKQAAPAVSRTGLVIVHGNAINDEALRLSREAAKPLDVAIEAFPVQSVTQLEECFRDMTRSGVNGVIVPQDFLLESNMERIGGLALAHKLPLVASLMAPGVLVAYSRDPNENYRKAARYVDKILNGADPGRLPVEEPLKYILAVNAKTSAAIGLTIPQSLLLRADVVIQ